MDGPAQIDKIEIDCNWGRVNLEKGRPDVFQVYGEIAWIKVFLAQNCNDNFISKGIPHYHFRVLNT